MGRHYHARCSTTNTIIKFYSFRVCKFVKNSISGTGLTQVKKILRFYRLVNFVHYMQREKSEHKEKRSICYKKNKELRSRKYQQHGNRLQVHPHYRYSQSTSNSTSYCLLQFNPYFSSHQAKFRLCLSELFFFFFFLFFHTYIKLMK